MTRDADPLRPQKPGGMGRGAMIATVVHVLLIAALAFGVNWRASDPEGMTAELWSATPQAAAPRAVEPPPAPPAPPDPKPTPAPEPPKPRVEEPPQPDPQIAIEQERKEREAKERAEREKQEREKAERERREQERQERERERLEKERAEKERQEKLKREEQARERRLAELTEKQRQEQIERIRGLAGATGGPQSTGTAQRSAGPSAGYAGRIRAAIQPNITLLNAIVGNPEAQVEVRAAPDGTILSRRLVKSSGNPTWDNAVLTAIDRTRVLPRDTDGRVPSPMELVFRPQDN
jgi:colicin import membrane protein